MSIRETAPGTRTSSSGLNQPSLVNLTFPESVLWKSGFILFPEKNVTHPLFSMLLSMFGQAPMNMKQLKQLLQNDNLEAMVPYVHMHEDHYLIMVTEKDSQVTIQLVFQLASSLAPSLLRL